MILLATYVRMPLDSRHQVTNAVDDVTSNCTRPWVEGFWVKEPRERRGGARMSQGIHGRDLHSSTFWLDVSSFFGIHWDVSCIGNFTDQGGSR